MRLHVRAQQRVHTRLVARALASEPLDDVGIYPQRQERFRGDGLQPLARHLARELLRSPPGRAGARDAAPNGLADPGGAWRSRAFHGQLDFLAIDIFSVPDLKDNDLATGVV